MVIPCGPDEPEKDVLGLSEEPRELHSPGPVRLVGNYKDVSEEPVRLEDNFQDKMEKYVYCLKGHKNTKSPTAVTWDRLQEGHREQCGMPGSVMDLASISQKSLGSRLLPGLQPDCL